PTVLAETIGANVTRFVHSLRGLHQLKTAAGAWEHILPDALGSLRVVTDNAVAVLESRNYGVYGDLFGQTGISQTQYSYTGEPTDLNGLVYDRARYMSPALGQFVSLDPQETFNRYAYTDGNPVMRIDPSGLMNDAGGGGGTYKPKSILQIQTNAIVHIAISTTANLVTKVANSLGLGIVTGAVKKIETTAHQNVGGSYVWNESPAVQTAYNKVVFGGLNRINTNKDANKVVSAITASVQNGKLTTSNANNKPMLNLAPQMQNIFGYNVNYGGIHGEQFDPASDDGRISTLHLLDASLQISGYLQGKGSLSDSGIDTFHKVFGTMPDGITPMNVYLGADKSNSGAPDQGYTPSGLQNMYLGSQMSTAGMTHEFGHQLNRYYGDSLSGGKRETTFAGYTSNQVPIDQGNSYLYVNYAAHPCSLGDDRKCPGELLPDIFMTAVLNGQNYQGVDNLDPKYLVAWNKPKLQPVFDKYIKLKLNS
ncbi:MAG: RHS repeat-associated core domain-containing protein, partial [Chloroflexota bacterium]